ncbi:hypothetical protein PTKIN_Ptkin02bG0141800 [Pterospermum kingtungense]
MAEAVAANHALELASDLVLVSMVLEGDALNIIKSLNQRESDHSPIGILLDEARLKKTSFNCCGVSHTNREANNAVHTLAHYGLRLGEDVTWFETCPPCIQSIVLFESNLNE